MRKLPGNGVLKFIYYMAVKDWHEIAEDIAHYDRLEEGSGDDRGYEFLHEAVNRCLERRKTVPKEAKEESKPAAIARAVPARKVHFGLEEHRIYDPAETEYYEVEPEYQPEYQTEEENEGPENQWENEGLERYWLCDAACPFDLVSRDSLPPDVIQWAEEAAEPALLATANGQLNADTTIAMQVGKMMDNIEPFPLDDTPDVLSIGKRCVHYGYGFYWEPWSEEPYFVQPEADGGGIIKLKGISDTPYLVDYLNPPWKPQRIQDAAPAPRVPLVQAEKLTETENVPGPSSSDSAPEGGMQEYYIGDYPTIVEEGEPSSEKWPDLVPEERERWSDMLPEEQEEVVLSEEVGEVIPEELEEVEEQTTKRNLRKEAMSLDHLMVHRFFNPYCRACVESKNQRKHKRRGGLINQARQPVKFGEKTTGDHLIGRRKNGEAVEDEEYEFPMSTAAAALYDRGTGWITCHPQATRSTEDTIKAFQEFQGEDEIYSFYCDNAKELAAAAFRLGWPMPTSTPGVPDTNDLAERYICICKEGIRCFLLQARLHKSW